jgi:hypothetical protein
MSASLPLEILKRYKKDFLIFFETGTSEGDSTQTAIETGFETLYTVEYDRETYKRAYKRFEATPNVHVYNSNSVEALSTVLPHIPFPIMFFLDAHADSGVECSPMLKELEVIKRCKYPVSIMIDDMRLIGHQKWNEFTLPQLIDSLHQINPSFDIVFEENGHAPGDLLVAYVP